MTINKNLTNTLSLYNLNWSYVAWMQIYLWYCFINLSKLSRTMCKMGQKIVGPTFYCVGWLAKRVIPHNFTHCTLHCRSPVISPPHTHHPSLTPVFARCTDSLTVAQSRLTNRDLEPQFQIWEGAKDLGRDEFGKGRDLQSVAEWVSVNVVLPICRFEIWE